MQLSKYTGKERRDDSSYWERKSFLVNKINRSFYTFVDSNEKVIR